MKIFQIVDDICYWDATLTVPTLEDAARIYPPDLQFVEAPDYVFEGWGYDDEDEVPLFIRPEAPEGWNYDGETGTFYKDGDVPPSRASKTNAELTKENEELKELVTELELAIAELYEEGLNNG